MTTPQKPKAPPLLNIPPMTRNILILMGFVYLAQEVGMDVSGKAYFFNTFGFLPTNFSDFTADKWMSLFSPLTYMFIHGSLVHLIINGVMLLAFGAGLERTLGAKRMLAIFFVSGLVAILIHFIFYTFSPSTVIGASGATSGLFAAGIIMLRNAGTGIGSGPYGLYPLIALFIVMTVVFGLTTAPGGASVAWVAHLGGFAAGLGMMKLMKQL
ncbi:MAG: rhomboid family intramembrane serine protease [Rhodospirillales bacterium]|nr:rhomboid family intramembrane serine protease [Rhodospirillales bacterium]MCB9973356.1 rhomboid family intramembrane serine protease [Rhodospirillales bacterium]MCB9980557.1 rhomboid family intramembrane serine protease [Rhodospirillales bacterium]